MAVCCDVDRQKVVLRKVDAGGRRFNGDFSKEEEGLGDSMRGLSCEKDKIWGEDVEVI
jgi:hypothetical protein